MANTRSANTWVIDTNGAISETLIIKGVKIVAGSANASLTIKKGGSSGTTVYSTSTTANTEKLDLVSIKILAGSTPYMTISGSGAVAYLYLK